MGNKKSKLQPKKKANSKKPVREKKEKNDFDWDAWESEARKRSAWGGYVQTMNQIRTRSEENELQHAKSKGDIDKVKEIEKDREGRIPMLYIG